MPSESDIPHQAEHAQDQHPDQRLPRQAPGEPVLDAVVRALSRYYFRVSVEGVANIPDHGGAVLTANHAGTVPVDTLLIMEAIKKHHPRARPVHNIADDFLFQVPVVGDYARKTGRYWPTDVAVTRRLLREGELVLIYPEGMRGLGKGYDKRYQVQDFGTGGFAASAINARVPIIPVSVIGTEEIYPMIADCKPLARKLGLPYFPITPTLPLLGLGGLLPLPAKVTIVFGEPILPGEVDIHAPGELRRAARGLAGRVRDEIQATLHERLRTMAGGERAEV